MKRTVFTRFHLFLFGVALAILPFPALSQQLAWQTPAPNTEAIHVSAEGNVTVIDDKGVLRTFDPNGQVSWSLDLGSPAVGGLAATPDGGFVVATENSHLFSVSSTGQKRFDATLPAPPNGSPAVGADGVAYVAADTKLVAYTPAGDLKWTFDDQTKLTATPAVGASGVAIGQDEGGAYFVDLSGKMVYNYDVLESIPYHLVVTPAGTVNYLSTDSFIEGLDAQGNSIFTVEPDEADAKYSRGKEIDQNGILYVVVGSNEIQAVEPDGSIGWTYPVDADVSTPLTITADNRLIFGTSDARIVTLDLQGQKQTETKIGSSPSGVAAGPNGRYYALLGGGGSIGAADLLVALVPPDTTPPLWAASGLSGQPVLDLARSPKDPHTVYATGDKTIWVSTDDGKTWTPNDAVVTEGDTHVNHVAVASDGTVYAATQLFLLASDASGANFGLTNRADGIGAVAVNPKDPANVVFTDSTQETLYNSSDRGVSVIPETTPVIFTDLLWASDGTMYATANDGLYEKAAGGDWTKAMDGRTTRLAATDDGKTVYAGGDGRILRSTDSGKTFQELAGNRFVGTVYSIALNPDSPSEMMAGTVLTTDVLDNGSIRGINVYSSKDAGETWTLMNKGLVSINPHDLLGISGAFLLAEEDGIWRTDATGGSGGTGSGKRGDLNGDSKINVQDATLALRIAVGLVTPSATQLQLGDVAPSSQPDGKINVSDATRILRAAVGLDTL